MKTNIKTVECCKKVISRINLKFNIIINKILRGF